MAYLYETHLHTVESSKCGVSNGREYVQRYMDLGYSGIIITDHFFNGNCRADRNLPWKKWVQEYIRGYELTSEEGHRRGFDVFFCWEESLDGNDYLIYGLDKEWLLAHPEAAYWTPREQFDEVNRCGGCVVLAHPFRFVQDINRISVQNGCVNAVEAANSGNCQISDALAWAYAKKLKLSVTAGSDIHSAADIRSGTVFGIYLNKKMETIADYVNAVLNNTITKLKVPAGRFDLHENS
jgi:hypothetical protein